MNTKKAIAIGILTSAVITLVTFGIKTKKFENISNRITTPNANKQRTIETKAENDTIEDLQNTQWFFNDSQIVGFGTNQERIYNIEFYNDELTTFDQINISGNLEGTNTVVSYRYTENQITYVVYVGNYQQWYYTGTENQRIVITGGTDLTNTSLINWLYSNATLEYAPTPTPPEPTPEPIANLTNTSWKIKETLPTITAGQLNANINFYNNGNVYTTFRLGYNYNGDQQANCICYNSYLYYYNSQWQWGNSDQTYRQSSRIIIIGGNDVTNTSLINWLLENAEQYEVFSTVLNTKWTFIDNPISNYSNFVFNIQFTSGNKTCSQLKAGWTSNKNKIAYAWKPDRTTPYTFFEVYDGTNWTDNKFKTIIIINGTDVTSLSVISWLTCNAEGVAYQPIPTNPEDYDIENGNFVSLQSLMIQILTMPFTFISQAFNVTLWPNTAWEFNLSNFILGIIAIASLLFIIKLFTSGFSVIGKYTASRDDREFKRSQTKLNNSKAELNNRTDPNNKRITTKKE